MTLQCLESLALYTEPGCAQVLVVDNGSTDATAVALDSTLERLFGPCGKALHLPSNEGFARGCNAGARTADGDTLFFLNNDTLATAGWLPPLLQALDSPFVGMAGPLLLLPGSRRVQHCGIAFAPTLEVSHLYALFPGDHPLVRKKRMPQALTGAALLVSQQLFQQCGGFHEGYVNGFEDMDLCCAVRQRGLHLVTAPQSVLYHLTSQTPGRFDHDDPNARLLTQRCAGAFTPDLHKIAMEDGYIPVLSPSLELYLTLPPAKEQALTTTFARHWDSKRCHARLQAEPLWRGGYSLLGQHFEQQHLWTEACDVYSRQSHFFPLPEHALALARTAARCGQSELAAEAHTVARHMLEQAQDRAAVHKKADALARWAEDAGDMEMAKLFVR